MAGAFEQSASILDSMISPELSIETFGAGKDKDDAAKWVDDNQDNFLSWKKNLIDMVLKNVHEQDRDRFAIMLKEKFNYCIPAVPFGNMTMPRIQVSQRYVRLDAFLAALFRVIYV
jgi:hypothetical protein